MARAFTIKDRREEVAARLTALETEQEERLAQRRADQFRLPYVNLFSFPIDTGDLALIPKEEAARLGAVLYYKKGKDARLAVVNPNVEGIDELVASIQKETGVTVQLQVISHHSLRMVLGRYPEKVYDSGLERDEVSVTENMLQDWQKLLERVAKVGSGGVTMSPTEVLSIILAGAIVNEASDVHIEPGVERSDIRYRIDGVLQTFGDFDRTLWKQMLSRLKVLTQMKLNVHDTPQDGSFVIKLDHDEQDVRLSVLPGAHGEFIVMRLLAPQSREVKLEDLGMKERDYVVVQEALKQSTGLILTSGPTGSGKTTTVVACIEEVNRPELKIITLEDPIEYRIADVEQTQIDADAGYTFAAGLRSILRQDPDVVFVGEMRDAETAETSVNASLTGHLVFSTIHSNDAPGAVLRLVNMGLKPYVLAPSLRIVIAQRLVRLVCVECAESYSPDPSTVEHIRDVLQAVSKKVFDTAALLKEGLQFKKAVGCDKCRGTGYRGRTGLYEVLVVNGEVEELVLRGAAMHDIQEAALRTGMTTIAQDGYLKVIDGVTTIEEVARVSDE